MEWLERMNRAIDYIEANLTGGRSNYGLRFVKCNSNLP